MSATEDRTRTADGYRGVWFALGQYDGEHGDKYAGGLGTYTAKHVPMAVYDPAVERTFFTYGGSPPGERSLQVFVGTYDHARHAVRRPTLVDPKSEPDPGYDAETVVDPHDDASLALGADGHLWTFVAGRGRRRPGRVYRSAEPHDASAFEFVAERDHFAYPQPWRVGDGFLVLFTVYDKAGNRELHWARTDGRSWPAPRKLAGVGGHYQVSTRRDGTVVTAFNWHPGGDVDRRTNLYVVRTRDGGRTWESVGGRRVDPPLTDPGNGALVADYRARDRLVYLSDVALDAAGRPVVLYVTSGDHAPGPGGDPRRWLVTRWDGRTWRTDEVTTSDHNYDTGCLRVGETWRVLGPTEPGRRPYHTGGEVAAWRSDDRGATWTRERRATRGGGGDRHHTYVRRPQPAATPFEAFWADGDPARRSASRLHVGTLDGSERWTLPRSMAGTWERL
ncbi:MAG: BNR-4 repeat-containing protein [Halobacteriaceae archaeon]